MTRKDDPWNSLPQSALGRHTLPRQRDAGWRQRGLSRFIADDGNAFDHGGMSGSSRVMIWIMNPTGLAPQAA